MLPIEWCAATAHWVTAGFTFDAAWVQASATAHAAPLGDLFEHGVTPTWQTLRGEWLPLVAVFV